MTINVTKHDIQEGGRNKPHRCPTALAVARETHKVVRAAYDCIVVDGKFYNLPEVARCFISDFDLGKPVQPFSFDLPILK